MGVGWGPPLGVVRYLRQGNVSLYDGGERGIRTLELSSRSAICRKHVAKDATRAKNATPPCPILPDGLVIEAVSLPERPALPQAMRRRPGRIGSSFRKARISSHSPCPDVDGRKSI